jgi:hypothetical protein
VYSSLIPVYDPKAAITIGNQQKLIEEKMPVQRRIAATVGNSYEPSAAKAGVAGSNPAGGT